MDFLKCKYPDMQLGYKDYILNQRLNSLEELEELLYSIQLAERAATKGPDYSWELTQLIIPEFRWEWVSSVEESHVRII